MTSSVTEPPRAPRVIALCGAMGAGKTTAARLLGEIDPALVRVRFADPLKDMLACLGLTPHEVDGPLRAQPSPALCGRTPRHAMQTLGTEWGRALIGEDLWADAWSARVKKLLDQGEGIRVVADDLRFPNEIAALRRFGGVLWRIMTPGVSYRLDHESERQSAALRADAEILNVGTLDDLRRALAERLASHRQNR